MLHQSEIYVLNTDIVPEDFSNILGDIFDIPRFLAPVRTWGSRGAILRSHRFDAKRRAFASLLTDLELKTQANTSLALKVIRYVFGKAELAGLGREVVFDARLRVVVQFKRTLPRFFQVVRLRALHYALAIIQRQPCIPVFAIRTLIQLQFFVHIYCRCAVAHFAILFASVC